MQDSAFLFLTLVRKRTVKFRNSHTNDLGPSASNLSYYSSRFKEDLVHISFEKILVNSFKMTDG